MIRKKRLSVKEAKQKYKRAIKSAKRDTTKEKILINLNSYLQDINDYDKYQKVKKRAKIKTQKDWKRTLGKLKGKSKKQRENLYKNYNQRKEIIKKETQKFNEITTKKRFIQRNNMQSFTEKNIDFDVILLNAKSTLDSDEIASILILFELKGGSYFSRILTNKSMAEMGEYTDENIIELFFNEAIKYKAGLGNENEILAVHIRKFYHDKTMNNYIFDKD